MQAGASVDAALKDGTTAMFMAAQEGMADVMGLLMNAGGQVTTKRHDGFTPLLIAAYEGHVRLHNRSTSQEMTVVGHGGI
jgi:ankyrin repeat protein